MSMSPCTYRLPCSGLVSGGAQKANVRVTLDRMITLMGLCEVVIEERKMLMSSPRLCCWLYCASRYQGFCTSVVDGLKDCVGRSKDGSSNNHNKTVLPRVRNPSHKEDSTRHQGTLHETTGPF